MKSMAGLFVILVFTCYLAKQATANTLPKLAEKDHKLQSLLGCDLLDSHVQQLRNHAIIQWSIADSDLKGQYIIFGPEVTQFGLLVRLDLLRRDLANCRKNIPGKVCADWEKNYQETLKIGEEIKEKTKIEPLVQALLEKKEKDFEEWLINQDFKKNIEKYKDAGHEIEETNLGVVYSSSCLIPAHLWHGEHIGGNYTRADMSLYTACRYMRLICNDGTAKDLGLEATVDYAVATADAGDSPKAEKILNFMKDQYQQDDSYDGGQDGDGISFSEVASGKLRRISKDCQTHRFTKCQQWRDAFEDVLKNGPRTDVDKFFTCGPPARSTYPSFESEVGVTAKKLADMLWARKEKILSVRGICSKDTEASSGLIQLEYPSAKIKMRLWPKEGDSLVSL